MPNVPPHLAPPDLAPPKQAHTQAPTHRLRRRMLLLALPAACGLAAPAWATTGQRPPGAAARRARAQLDVLAQLQRDAHAAQGLADSLQARLQGLAGPWQAAQAAATPTQAALVALRSQALPALAMQHQRWRTATAAVDAAAGAHQAAAHQLLAAAPAARGAAMARLDTATTARQAAELAEQLAQQVLAQAMAATGQALALLGAHWQDLARPTSNTAATLQQAAQDWAALQRRWLALQAAAQLADLAAEAGHPALAHPAGAAWPALPQATAPWAVPAATSAAAAPAHTALQDWRGADRRSQQALQALWLQGDAQAAVQQALADSGCSAAACAAWQADAAALQASLARQQAALASAQAGQAEAAHSLHDLPAAAGQQLQALLAWRDSLAPAVADAGGPALQALQAASSVGAATLARLAEARSRAEAAWVAAMRAQYGQRWLPPPVAGATTRPSMEALAGSEQASMSAQLTSHALHRLRARGDEPAGFGAYTYVLVGASVRPGTPGVHGRLQRLLGEVRNLPLAGQMDTAQRAQANTFVVPTPADSPDHGDLVVDLPLAQSLLTHLPPALRLADATRRLLYAENGPFLVTLPGPLAAARADWPLLFADLSKTPEVVVADVVRRYMADLIGSFNPASTTWAPPAGMQVAIALVRMVKGSGDVVQAVFPALLR